MISIIHRTKLVPSLLAAGLALAFAACGGKAKKQETVPEQTSGGTDATAPEKSTTDTGTGTSPSGPALQDVIYFAFDQSDLDVDAKKKLEENAAWIKENMSRSLTIEGHTDESGTAEYNVALGERRARASRDYLVSLGVDASKISIISFGEERPASGEDSQNRRSVFVATKK